jgi:alkylation response protein AidB-like acyl-CoA dehydrogenase
MSGEHNLRVMSGFLQTPPRLPDAWSSDGILRDTLRWHVGDEVFQHAEPDLKEMGRVATDPRVLDLATRAEREQPELIPYGTWGERIDKIRVSEAWYELGRLGIEAGVTALPYEDTQFGDQARTIASALLVLWGPSSALYSCPVAMTDAAARTLMQYGNADDQEAVSHLTARDFSRAWTSGQWMTETAGGSDVGRTGTIARQDETGAWRLYGLKWFTSATTSEMALTLARPEGAGEGSAALGMFRVERLLPDGSPNSIFVRRLKDKLGTRALPTAELELQGTLATPIGDPTEGGGLRRIATMLNITRLHNAIGSAGAMARGLAWARAYSEVREVFGRPLAVMPAHRATLAALAVDYAATLTLALRCAVLTGKAEHGNASDDEIAALRALTPIAKAATARWAIAGVTEAMECVGGVGYCEDSTIPALVRNTHVQPIWEGTTNVLSLDVLRAAVRSGSVDALLADIESTVGTLGEEGSVGEPVSAVKRAVGELRDRWTQMMEDETTAQLHARPFAVGLGLTYASARLSAQGAWAARAGHDATSKMAARLAVRGLVPSLPATDTTFAMGDVL